MQAAGVSGKAARLYRIKTFASPELFSMVCTENLSFPKIRSGPDSHPEAESSHHPGDACDPALARMFVGDLFKSRLRGRYRAAETDCVAGHVGLELGNVG